MVLVEKYWNSFLNEINWCLSQLSIGFGNFITVVLTEQLSGVTR